MLRTDTETYIRWQSTEANTRPGKVAVFDLDDTLARYCKERRLPACADFEAMPLLQNALHAQGAGINVVIASARPEWCYAGTVEWLRKHNLAPTAVYLKNRYCTLPAHCLKETMLNDIINHHQEIIAYYEDNPFCCYVAEDLGIPTFFVPGNEDYWIPKGEKEGWFADREITRLQKVTI